MSLCSIYYVLCLDNPFVSRVFDENENVWKAAISIGWEDQTCQQLCDIVNMFYIYFFKLQTISDTFVLVFSFRGVPLS